MPFDFTGICAVAYRGLLATLFRDLQYEVVQAILEQFQVKFEDSLSLITVITRPYGILKKQTCINYFPPFVLPYEAMLIHYTAANFAIDYIKVQYFLLHSIGYVLAICVVTQ